MTGWRFLLLMTSFPLTPYLLPHHCFVCLFCFWNRLSNYDKLPFDCGGCWDCCLSSWLLSTAASSRRFVVQVQRLLLVLQVSAVDLVNCGIQSLLHPMMNVDDRHCRIWYDDSHSISLESVWHATKTAPFNAVQVGKEQIIRLVTMQMQKALFGVPSVLKNMYSSMLINICRTNSREQTHAYALSRTQDTNHENARNGISIFPDY